MYKQNKRKILNLNLLKDDSLDRTKKKKKKNHKKSEKEKSSSDNRDQDGFEIEDEHAVEDDVKINDPYVVHLKNELHPRLLAALTKSPRDMESTTFHWPTLGRIMFVSPKLTEDTTEPLARAGSTKLVIDGDESYAELRPFPLFSNDQFSFDQIGVKTQIIDNLTRACEIEGINQLTEIQKELLTIASNYQDLYFPEMTFDNCTEIRLSYCIHVVNHVLKSRVKIIHHNAKLAAKKDEDAHEFRDQGLLRPKVLILLPFREVAYRVIKMIINILLGESGHVLKKGRFNEEYCSDGVDSSTLNKPEDFRLLFTGNTDDNFRVGMTVTKKSLKLYSDFYSSDIIIASPLGLRMLIGADGEKDRNSDFLASIEILVMDMSHVMLMQNWEHVQHVLDHLHLQPKDAHGTDLARVRMWALNGCSRYYMQSLVFSFYPLPEITALFNAKFSNYAGKATVANPILSGSICQVAVQVSQSFHLIKSKTVLESVDDRFEVFVSDILPQFKNSSMKHILVYIPAYFDFVRLRNHFKRQEIKFVQICEYTDEKKIVRARSKLFHGETQFLLYTERYHFFRRVKLRGVKHIIFYQPPSLPNFYSEMCNFLQDMKTGEAEMAMTVNVLYTKFDITKMAAIVGSERATKMLASEKTVQTFMTSK